MPMDYVYVVFGTEASGFARGGKIIQVAFVVTDRELRPIDCPVDELRREYDGKTGFQASETELKLLIACPEKISPKATEVLCFFGLWRLNFLLVRFIIWRSPK